MALSFPAQFTTRTGHPVIVIEDHEGSAGWMCHGCHTIAEPPFVGTPLDSAKAHADICTTA